LKYRVFRLLVKDPTRVLNLTLMLGSRFGEPTQQLLAQFLSPWQS
jgi:hypothetical protein